MPAGRQSAARRQNRVGFRGGCRQYIYMTLVRLAAALTLVWLISSPATAQSLLDKISNSTEKAADAVKSDANRVGESISSTKDLATNEATPEETRAKLDVMAGETLDRLFTETPPAKDLFEQSAGYAVFDTRKVTVFPIAAGFGRGVAVSAETEQRTYMMMGTGGAGAAIGIGGFEAQIVILFEQADAFNSFVVNGYDATAETGTKYGDDTTDQSVRFIDGRSVFVLGTRGWRVGASASGTRYWPDDDLN